MAIFSSNVPGARRNEGINQARKVYNTDQAALAAAQTPPGSFTPLTREQYVEMCVINMADSWARHYSDEVDAALAAPEMQALRDAKAALRAKAGAVDAP